jgi:hypothetical protein
MRWVGFASEGRNDRLQSWWSMTGAVDIPERQRPPQQPMDDPPHSLGDEDDVVEYDLSMRGSSSSVIKLARGGIHPWSCLLHE